MIPDAASFAKGWIDSWNSHDIGKIMDHYGDSIEVTTPMIQVALGIDSGTLSGREAVRRYWTTALEKVPDLHFELREVTSSISSIAVYYQAVFGKMAIEVFFFDDTGKITRVIAHYA